MKSFNDPHVAVLLFSLFCINALPSEPFCSLLSTASLKTFLIIQGAVRTRLSPGRIPATERHQTPPGRYELQTDCCLWKRSLSLLFG